MIASAFLLTGCAQDAGKPQPAYTDPVPLADGPVRIYDNTDVFRGSANSDPRRVAMAVEDFYRNAGSYETKLKAAEVYAMEDETKRSVGIIKLYAPLKEFTTKTGNTKDPVIYRYFGAVAQGITPDPALGKYAYDFVLREKSINVDGDRATVDLTGSVHLVNGNSFQVPEGMQQLKLVKIQGEWFLDMDSTLG